jgi:uncharacterized protein YecE (DUF72 family)
LELRIGCTGWSYESWIGRFYPKNLETSNFLRYYSSLFDITEINSTFYRIPSQDMTKKWNSHTPENFRFTAKFPKSITHEHRLENCQKELGEFFYVLQPLKQKISALVIQLPPSFLFDEAKPRLENLAQHLPEDYRFAIEGRDKSWFTDEALKFLSEHNLCLVWNEVYQIKNPAPLTSDYVYLRLIGDRAIPERDFGKVVRNQDGILKNWAQKVKDVQDKVKLAVIVANNRFEGFSPATANSLRTIFGLSEVSWHQKKQRRLGEF